MLRVLQDFAERERREKNAEVVIRSLKLRTLMRRGRIPDLRIRTRPNACFLIESRKGRETRIYFFDLEGRMLGAEDFEMGDARLRELLHHSRRLPG